MSSSVRPAAVTDVPPDRGEQQTAVYSDKIDPNTGLRRVLIAGVHAFPFHGKLDVRQRRIGDELPKVFD